MAAKQIISFLNVLNIQWSNAVFSYIIYVRVFRLSLFVSNFFLYSWVFLFLYFIKFVVLFAGFFNRPLLYE